MQPTQPKTVPAAAQGQKPGSKLAAPVKAPIPLDAEVLQQIAGGTSPGRGW